MCDYNYEGEFRKKHSFENRKRESKRVMDTYEARIPIIVENDKHSKLPLIKKRKYLVPDDMTVGQFSYVIRKRMKIKPEIAIYLFFNQNLVPTAAQIKEIYPENKNEDGFLYTVICAEKTFGNPNKL